MILKHFFGMMKFILLKFGIFGKAIFKFGGLLPVGIFVVSQFIIDLVQAGLLVAFYGMAHTVFAAELNINRIVHLAIANDPSYNIWLFLSALISIYILYALVRFLTKLQVGVSGSQAVYGAALLAVIAVAIIEISAIAVIDGSFGFFPVYNGIFFFFSNLPSLLGNMFGSAAVAIANNPVIINETINSTLNTTFT